MAVLIAKDQERLEVLYHENHDTTLVTYPEFLKENTHLLSKDLLESGDEVTVIERVREQGAVTVTQRATLW